MQTRRNIRNISNVDQCFESNKNDCLQILLSAGNCSSNDLCLIRNNSVFPSAGLCVRHSGIRLSSPSVCRRPLSLSRAQIHPILLQQYIMQLRNRTNTKYALLITISSLRSPDLCLSRIVFSYISRPFPRSSSSPFRSLRLLCEAIFIFNFLPFLT